MTLLDRPIAYPELLCSISKELIVWFCFLRVKPSWEDHVQTSLTRYNTAEPNSEWRRSASRL